MVSLLKVRINVLLRIFPIFIYFYIFYTRFCVFSHLQSFHEHTKLQSGNMAVGSAIIIRWKYRFDASFVTRYVTNEKTKILELHRNADSSPTLA